ncbi:ferritin-like domain-containing protein [Balneatrix alpica]|uniref:ferritin-like domain-containing protein n=1 Tax=Balneatrix alpica TaxID=75684 RepID=UPI002738C2ED|nr:ferritin-like domain-containing protein [Balneatrix alpica]
MKSVSTLDAATLQAEFAAKGYVSLQSHKSLQDELADLRELLQSALALEHATIPPYLTMLYTLPSQTQWQVVEIIRSVVVEEMLHFSLVANVLNAIGGEPQIASPGFMPDYPAALPYGIDGIRVSLFGFSHEGVEQGMAIERPAVIDPLKVASFRRNEMTIGEFYAFIEARLRAAVARYGEQAVFCGDPSRQIPPHAFYYDGGGGILEVHNLKQALQALQLIVDQGEGTPDSEWTGPLSEEEGGFREVAHYYRFQQLQLGRLYQPGDKVNHPSGSKLEVPWQGAIQVPVDMKLADYPEGEVRQAVYRFNQRYCQLLAQLQLAFTGQPGLLLPAVVGMCSLRDDFNAITANPLPGFDEYHCVPTFEYVAPDLTLIKRVAVAGNEPRRGCPMAKAQAMQASPSGQPGVATTLARLQQAYSQGDLPLALSCLAESVIWDISGPVEVPYLGVFYGHQGFSRFWTLLGDTVNFGSAGIEAVFIDGLAAMAYGGEQGSTKATGAPYHYDWAIRYQFDANFKITLMRQYFDPDPIRAALRASAYPQPQPKK